MDDVKGEWPGYWRARAETLAAVRGLSSRSLEQAPADAQAERLAARVKVLEQALRRIGRGAELQAHVMRDPLRTGGWAGAEKVADAFDDIADRAREALL